jgi:hypothetical protein
MHGMGVNTPIAAAVAATTAGFAGERHMTKGRTLTIGLLSRMFAAGVPVNVRLCGSTVRDDGATPKLHIVTAPEQTCIGI